MLEQHSGRLSLPCFQGRSHPAPAELCRSLQQWGLAHPGEELTTVPWPVLAAVQECAELSKECWG